MPGPVDPKKRRTHRLVYTIIVVALLAGIALMLHTQTEMLGGTITVDELAKHIGQDPYNYAVIDVRPSSEFHAGHIPFSHNVPIEQVGKGPMLDELKTHQIVVVGEGTKDAQSAITLLQRAGFGQNGSPLPLYLPDGAKAWRDSGRDFTPPDTAVGMPVHPSM